MTHEYDGDPPRRQPPPLPPREAPPLTQFFHACLAERGMDVAISGDEVVEKTTGLLLFPEGGQVLREAGGVVQTCTTIAARHQRFPEALMEFQHSIGEDQISSIVRGFDTWLELDWPVLVDACLESPEHCMSMIMNHAEADDLPAYTRRVILGPVQLMGVGDEVDPESQQGHAAGCACCLFTNTVLAYQEYVNEPGAVYAIRLFAMRDEAGNVSADCRINGHDWEPGAEALRRYASSWPPGSFQSRKQYILVQ